VRNLIVEDRHKTVDPAIEPTRHSIEDVRAFLANDEALAKEIDSRFIRAFVRVTKPAAKSCCGPNCCS
jgi:hypothetical protein